MYAPSHPLRAPVRAGQNQSFKQTNFFYIDKQTVAVFMWLIDPDTIWLIVSQLAGEGAERLNTL